MTITKKMSSFKQGLIIATVTILLSSSIVFARWITNSINDNKQETSNLKIQNNNIEHNMEKLLINQESISKDITTISTDIIWIKKYLDPKSIIHDKE